MLKGVHMYRVERIKVAESADTISFGACMDTSDLSGLGEDGSSEDPTLVMDSAPEAEGPRRELALSLAGATDQGGRLRNEDSYLLKGDSCVVSDGIGGAPYGDLFSKLCCRAFVDDWKTGLGALPPTPWQLDGEKDLEPLMRSTFVNVDGFVSRVGSYIGKGSGATLIAAVRCDKNLLLGSVGDTAAFCLDERGELARVMRDSGRAEGRGNALSEAMGYRVIEGDKSRVQTARLPLAEGMRVVLCSDGVWTQLSRGRMAEILRESGDPYVSAFRLVHEAVEAYGARSDNATAVVIHVSAPLREELTPTLPKARARDERGH